MRLMTDLGYDQLLNPNQSLKLVFLWKEIIENSFSNISTMLTKDFTASHSLKHSLQIPRVDNPTMTIESPSKTSCYIQYMTFWRSHG